MNMITIVTIGFLMMETANITALYFFPDSKFANSMGVFKAWEKSKEDAQVHDLMKYMVNWVAGTKLIFIMLLVVILLTGNANTKTIAAIAMVISIASFFWRLFPLVKKMDSEEQLDPSGYSKTLGVLIGVMIALFLIAFVVVLV